MSFTPTTRPPRGHAADRVIASLRAELEASPPGAPLSSVRELCERHGASPNTVQRAIAALVREGLVQTIPGRGSFVVGAPAREAAPDLGWQAVVLGARPSVAEALDGLVAPLAPDAIPLRAGYLDPSLQPLGALHAALSRASRRPGTWSRTPPEGSPELRAWFAREAGGGLTGADTLIVPGGQSALTVILRALLQPGAPVLLESPTYPGAVAVARAAGLAPVPVPVDHEGVRPELLAAAFQATGARVFYCQPTFSNPTGGLLGEARRRAVLEIAEAAGAFVVEDDYAHDLSSIPVPPTLVSRDAGRVIHVRSLTKSTAPGLRIAAIAARGPVFARLRAARLVDDLFVSGVLQEAALDLVTGPTWSRHLRQIQAELRSRRDAGAAALAALAPLGVRLWSRPLGGQNLWVGLPRGVEDRAFTARMEAAGVALNAGGAFFPAEAQGSFVRLSVAGATVAQIEEGVRRMGRALQDQAR